MGNLYNETWTPEQCEQLTKLWADGLTQAQIGERMGVTKSAVNGKVKRLGLPKRRNPIEEQGTVRKSRKAPVKASRAEAAKCLAKLLSLPNPLKKPVAPVPQPVPGRVSECAYPKQLPGQGPIRFSDCGQPTEPGKPYCHTHANLCYARTPEQKKAALREVAACPSS